MSIREWPEVDYDTLTTEATVWPATHGSDTNNHTWIGDCRTLTVAVENDGANAITASKVQVSYQQDSPDEWYDLSSGDLNAAAGASAVKVLTEDILGVARWARIKLTSAVGCDAKVNVTGERRNA